MWAVTLERDSLISGLGEEEGKIDSKWKDEGKQTIVDVGTKNSQVKNVQRRL